MSCGRFSGLVARHVGGVFGHRQIRERLHGLVVAQGVAAQCAVQLRERLGEAERDLVVDAVDGRKRLPVVDAGFGQHQDHGRADLEAGVGGVAEAVEPVTARDGVGKRSEFGAYFDAAPVERSV